MPRAAVPQEKRRRVARACDSCKRRKERCNGAQPCSICTRRRKESGCSFSDTPARLLRPGNAQDSKSLTSNGNSTGSVHNQSTASIDRYPSCGDDDLKGSDNMGEGDEFPESTAPVPRLARLLRDGRGKFVYIGDSASLSFLQSIRRLVTSSLGDCEFTTDPMRHSIVETTPSHPVEESPEVDPMSIGHERVRSYAHAYLTATSGLFDLFDDTFLSDLDDWVSNPSQNTDLDSPLYYQIIAIGAQVGGDQDLAEQCFAHGRRLAYLSNIDAPSVLTVQIFILMSTYLLGACRRNAAFMNFGMACRASMALGMHKSSTHSLFGDAEVRARLRTWTGVRVLDMFFSGTLGRPPATSDLASDSILETGCQHYNDMDRFSQKVLKLCGITERILLDVWEKKAASTRLADAISRKYRDWTADLPAELQLQKFVHDHDPGKLKELLAASHVITSYHCSIILLTRPFLKFQILKDINRRDCERAPTTGGETRESSAMKTFADACVDSALRNLTIAHDLIIYASLPKRLPFILDSVCNSCLVLGAAVFADQDTVFPLLDGLDQGLQVLNHFAPQDPHAHRYAEIITYLHKAVKKHIHNRNQVNLHTRGKEVARLFGDVDRPPETMDKVSAEPAVDVSATAWDSHSPASFVGPNLGPLANYNSQYEGSDLFPYPDASMPFYDPARLQTPGVAFGQIQQQYGEILGEGISFPDDAYLFMEQDPSMFGLWNQ